jgi:Asp-tRNA(Asn)/Glu-tRNA(Gln) amidotransferase B subunit
MKSREAVVNSLVGYVMKKLPAANPRIVKELVIKQLEDRSK